MKRKIDQKPNPEMARMMELVDKNIKTAIINTLRMFKKVEALEHKETNERYKKDPNQTSRVKKIQWLGLATDHILMENLVNQKTQQQKLSKM